MSAGDNVLIYKKLSERLYSLFLDWAALWGVGSETYEDKLWSITKYLACQVVPPVTVCFTKILLKLEVTWMLGTLPFATFVAL